MLTNLAKETESLVLPLTNSDLWICFAIETLLALCIENKKIGHKKFPFIPYMSAGLTGTYLIQFFF